MQRIAAALSNMHLTLVWKQQRRSTERTARLCDNAAEMERVAARQSETGMRVAVGMRRVAAERIETDCAALLWRHVKRRLEPANGRAHGNVVGLTSYQVVHSDAVRAQPRPDLRFVSGPTAPFGSDGHVARLQRRRNVDLE